MGDIALAPGIRWLAAKRVDGAAGENGGDRLPERVHVGS